MLLETWLALFPTILVLVLAFTTKKIIPSLVSGIVLGIGILHWKTPKSGFSYLSGLLYHDFINRDHILIITFTILIAASVKFMETQGGFQAITDKLQNKINDKKKLEYFTWCSGILIFFDDYANTLIVGNTTKTLGSKFKVSKEKLAYIVDSTSAPMASIGLITTWIGFQLSQIKTATADLDIELNSYQLFMGSLQYAYYPILTIIFIGIIIYSQRDFGPMLKAERNIKDDNHSKISSEPSRKGNSYYAILPIVTLITVTLLYLIITGKDKENNTLTAILGNSDPYLSIFIGALSSFISCLLIEGFLGFSRQTLQTTFEGAKQVLEPIYILLAAWAFADVLADLKTAEYLIRSFSLELNPVFIPVLIFFIASLISFTTGSSFGTMSIVYPIVIPFVWELVNHAPGISQITALEIMYATVSVVLAGAVFGDHCSPISDTTILSSTATGCNHIDHVKTQLPYAVTVGFISAILLLLGFVYNIPWWGNFMLGLGLITSVIYLMGKKINQID